MIEMRKGRLKLTQELQATEPDQSWSIAKLRKESVYSSRAEEQWLNTKTYLLTACLTNTQLHVQPIMQFSGVLTPDCVTVSLCMILICALYGLIHAQSM